MHVFAPTPHSHILYFFIHATDMTVTKYSRIAQMRGGSVVKLVAKIAVEVIVFFPGVYTHLLWIDECVWTRGAMGLQPTKDAPTFTLACIYHLCVRETGDLLLKPGVPAI
jgi:hypothetical protein